MRVSIPLLNPYWPCAKSWNVLRICCSPTIYPPLYLQSSSSCQLTHRYPVSSFIPRDPLPPRHAATTFLTPTPRTRCPLPQPIRHLHSPPHCRLRLTWPLHILNPSAGELTPPFFRDPFAQLAQLAGKKGLFISSIRVTSPANLQHLKMSRGNQREVDRQRSQKRKERAAQKKKKTTGNGAQALTNKKEHDAEIMRQKQQKAMEKKATASPSNPSDKKN